MDSKQQNCLAPWIALVGVIVLAVSGNALGMPTPRLVADIATGAASSAPSQFVNIGTETYFVATTPDTGPGLWKSDGTARGTALVKAISASNLTVVGGTLFFVGNGLELWKSDGTEAGTALVKVFAAPTVSLGPTELVDLQGTLFFVAWSFDTGFELWKSDGTTAGTEIVTDYFSGGASSSPSALTVVGNLLFYTALSGPFDGRELFASDGTEAGTGLVKDIYPGSSSSAPAQLTAVGDTLYFVADDGVAGRELWRSDGTEAGTVLVKEFWPGPTGGQPVDLVDFNGTLYLSASTFDTGLELWKSDGTGAGTEIVVDYLPGGASSWPTDLTVVGDTLYYVAQPAPFDGPELFASDGTEAGTMVVKDINPGTAGSIPGDLTAVGDTLYFVADDGLSGRELWRSDGTVEGTEIVGDLYAGPMTSEPQDLHTADTMLYFSADDGTAARELWAVATDAAPDNVGFWRPNLRLFYLDADGNDSWSGPSGGDIITATWGVATTADIPIVGDWNADGFDELGFWRPAEKRFYLDLNGSRAWDGWVGGDLRTPRWAIATAADKPVVGDWNGDGRDDVGLWRPGATQFYLDMNGNNVWNGVAGGDTITAPWPWVKPADIPVAGDWDGDGRASVGFWRPLTKRFNLDGNGDGAWSGPTGGDTLTQAWAWATAAEVPVVGDWNADGIDNVGLWRPSFKRFYLDANGNGAWDSPAGGDIRTLRWGLIRPADKPVTGRW